MHPSLNAGQVGARRSRRVQNHPRRRGRLLLAAILAVAIATIVGLLAVADFARAGTMRHLACSDTNGITSFQGWSVKTGGNVTGGTSAGSAEIRCGAGGIVLTLGTDRPTNLGVYADAAYAAPADTKIVDAQLNMYWYLTWPSPPGGVGSQNPYALRVWHDDWSPSNMMIVSDIWIAQRLERAWHVHRESGIEWSSITARLTCADANNGAQCNHGGGEFWLGNAQIDLRDDAAPSVANGEGTLVSGSTTTGTASVRFNTADRGVGVYRTMLSVDGQVVTDKITDENAGRCVPRAGRYAFGWAVPCKLATSDELSWDSRTVSDGTHRISVDVEDAAGNRSVVLDRTVTTDNKPLNTESPAITVAGGRAQVGAELTLSRGTWQRAPTSYEVDWLRCTAGTTDSCVSIDSPEGSWRYVLRKSDAYHEIRARVRAVNASGGSAFVLTGAPAVIADANGVTDPRPRMLREPKWVSAVAAGTARVGDRLQLDPGEWAGPELTVTAAFKRCTAAGCEVLPTDPTGYTVQPADTGSQIVAEVTATNFAGSASASTPRSSAVVAADEASGRDRPNDGDDRPKDRDPGRPNTPAEPTYRIDALSNPNWGQGHAPNGVGASENARVTASFEVRIGTRRTRAIRVRSKRSQRQVIRGQVVNDAGMPIGAAKLVSAWQQAGGRWIAKTGVTTLADGRFVYILPMGASRSVRFIYFAFGDSTSYAVSNTITQLVQAPVTMRVSPSRTRNGQTVRFSGSVGRDGLPSRGVLVTLEATYGGDRWKQFKVARTTKGGRFAASYRFTSTSTRTRYRFRARVAKQGQYPFETGVSRAVPVTVTP